MVSSSMLMRNAAAIGLALGMAGCSWLGMDTSSKVTPRPGAATGDPNLASVPAKPQPILTPEQRKALMQDLVRDRENARYSDQAVRIGEVPEAAPPRPAPPRPASRPAAGAATAAAATSDPAASPAGPTAKSDDDSPWWWPFGGGGSAKEPEPAPAPEARAAPPPPAPLPAAPAPSASASPADPAADDSPWWWPFGGKKAEPIVAAPSAQQLATEANSIAATPENMRAPAGVMPVTGKPLPTPDTNQPAPGPLVMAPVPATPPAPNPAALRIGGGTAPQGATVPVMPPVDAPPPRATLRPDTAGRAPPPPPVVAELPPPSPAPARGVPAGAAVVRILAGSIVFPAGASTLPTDAAPTLEGAARMNKEHGGKVRVVAETLRSAGGTAGDALLASSALASERSAAVSRELVRLGVPDNAIVVGTAPGGAGREPRSVDVYVEY